MLYAVVRNAANCPRILIRRSLLFFILGFLKARVSVSAVHTVAEQNSLGSA